MGWRRTYVDDDEVVLEPPAGSPQDGVAPDLVLLQVPEAKAGKNRLHLDLRPEDQAAEVARLEELGARRVEVGLDASVSWVVMGDPDRNEFCVLRPLTEAELADRADAPDGTSPLADQQQLIEHGGVAAVVGGEH